MRRNRGRNQGLMRDSCAEATDCLGKCQCQTRDCWCWLSAVFGVTESLLAAMVQTIVEAFLVVY